jgi:hypothetical protein
MHRCVGAPDDLDPEARDVDVVAQRQDLHVLCKEF